MWVEWTRATAVGLSRGNQPAPKTRRHQTAPGYCAFSRSNNPHLEEVHGLIALAAATSIQIDSTLANPGGPTLLRGRWDSRQPKGSAAVAMMALGCSLLRRISLIELQLLTHAARNALMRLLRVPASFPEIPGLLPAQQKGQHAGYTLCRCCSGYQAHLVPGCGYYQAARLFCSTVQLTCATS